MTMSKNRADQKKEIRSQIYQKITHRKHQKLRKKPKIRKNYRVAHKSTVIERLQEIKKKTSHNHSLQYLQVFTIHHTHPNYNASLFIEKTIVASRSHGYGDTTTTYICRAMVPSRMYAKHQYIIGIRVRKYVVIYIPIQKYKYSVITICDIILHKYYITTKYKSRLYRVQKIRTHELKEIISRAGKTE